ncbi:hypothetical protein [Marinimicrobium sp. ARAG 43.8]|uniref:hypothetical protein n=1 Tax=Marinimicrobium sp. ARAG 43.8 TaxID=3418719 RepID=UPI003CF37814
MNNKFLPWVVMACALTLSACGGDAMLGDDTDTDMMYPDAGMDDPTDRPRPPENEPTMTTNEHFLLDVSGSPVQLRGVTLNYFQDPAEMVNAIEPIASTGANAVRLLVSASTAAAELEGALSIAAENNLVTVVSLTDDGSALKCQENTDALINAVDSLWLDQWLEVLVQDRFQGRIILNIADGWGPANIFNASSLGYQDYVDTYKALIRRFRNAGFKLPLMIDGANCGQDFNAFLQGRGEELLAADSESNLIFSAEGDGQRWDSADKIISANTLLAAEGVPFVMNAFAGSGVGDFPVNHNEIMAQAVGDVAFVVDTPWTGDVDDGVGYLNAFGEPLDLTGGATSLDVFMDRRYLEFMRVNPGSSNYAPTGTTGVSLYLMDANGNRLRLGTAAARELRENTWNKLRFDVPVEIEPDQLMAGSTEFDRTAVTHVGVEIMANDKAEAAQGEIKFDNLDLFPGVPPMYTAEFNTAGDAEGWEVMGADSSVVDGNLQALSTDAQISVELVGSNISLIDFRTPVNVTITMFLPEEYAGDGLWMQAYGQLDDWAWRAMNLSASQLVPGQWSELKYTINVSELGDSPPSDEANPAKFGFQVGGIITPKPEPILIDSIVIEDPAARPTKIVTETQYKATFSDGLNGFQDAGWDDGSNVSHGDGVLVASIVPASERLSNEVEFSSGAIAKGDVNAVQEINFGGALTVKARLFVPGVFADTGLELDVYFQSGSWQHFVIGQVNMDELNYDEWNDIEFEVADDGYPTTDDDGWDEDFARTLSPQAFGFQYRNISDISGEIMLDDVEIIGDAIVDDLQPIYQQGFDSPGSVQDLTVDFTTGGLNEGDMLVAKSSGWHVVPFGWMASTWFGGEALSLSEQPDEVVLTERGEQIINGPDGIAETSEAVLFE